MLYFTTFGGETNKSKIPCFFNKEWPTCKEDKIGMAGSQWLDDAVTQLYLEDISAQVL